MTEVAELEAVGGDVAIAEAPAPKHAAHAHPKPSQYVFIAVILVVITGLEVAVSYIDRDALSSNVIIVMLLGMAFVKFVLVISWYMHLKTDLAILRRFFYVGLVGAPLLYFVVTAVMQALMSDHNTPPTLAP